MQLPASTVVNRFIPKEKFYSKTSVSAKLRQHFTDEIEKITWTHKISPDTLNITADGHTELQVFEISLKHAELSMVVLKHIDTFIPYPILFILRKPGACKAALSYKESTLKDANKMKVDSYFDTGWKQHLVLELKGRSVDEIYKNFLYQVAPSLNPSIHQDAKTAVEINKERAKLQKQIDTLNRKIASELSIAKKQELARERFHLEQQMISMV